MIHSPLFDNGQERQESGGAKGSRHWPEPPSVLLNRLQAKVGQCLLGKETVIRHMTIALLAGGHVLLEDIPGVGKTMLAQALARMTGGEFKRIQFTSDMLPADVIGGVVLEGSGGLVYRPGPIMANVVLADEINRTSPRTQSALLEAMEERRVTIEGQTRRLPLPFMLIATQNPIAFEGTSQLPEAQMDRFMMRLSIGYPEAAQEQQMLAQYAEGSRTGPERLRPVIVPQEWQWMQEEARSAYIHPSLLAYMVKAAEATRTAEQVILGVSPRALRDWLRAAQASAYLEGRGYVVPDDLLGTAEQVLAHRLVLKGWSGQSGGMDAAAVIRTAVRQTPLPPEARHGRRGEGRAER